ncbi:MAG TPA: TMEM175 family protein [Dokdonella sp.]|uniref:TMEM175 family protein n=1 Tax=Dokdonella sp. TaxID=2291710 RepID=UPI002D7EBD0F|nr:TMEM175 family protein [Dokdonella sp.]HET9033936.1 TMEM175 family protein [Dokdonella sp.]
MGKSRMEAFSDGVLAIIITIMVLELKVPHSEEISSLAPLLPVLFSYVLSFIYVGIYWNNHHHLLHATRQVGGGTLWANLHLLFWLSLLPFVTGWMGENHFSALPTALYGCVLLMASIAYWFLVRRIIANEGKDSLVFKAVGKDSKGIISTLLYVAAIPLAFVQPGIAQGIFILVAILWLIPDRRIEKVMSEHNDD